MHKDDDIVEQLRTISETLAERALEVLKEAHAHGEMKRPDRERALTQARRAIEKAVNLLSRIERASD